MKQGFVKVAAVTPQIKVADPQYNAERIKERLSEAYEKGAKVIVFPELCLTGYTCCDLFLQELLLEEALRQLLGEDGLMRAAYGACRIYRRA